MQSLKLRDLTPTGWLLAALAMAAMGWSIAAPTCR